VVGAIGYGELYVRPADGGLGQVIRIADCSVLRRLATLHACSDGDAFVAAPPGAARTGGMITWEPGVRMRAGEAAHAPLWTVPTVTDTVPARQRTPQGDYPDRMLLLTPEAAGAALRTQATSTVGLTYRTTVPDVQDRIRTSAAALDPRFSIALPTPPKGDVVLTGIRRALLAGVIATMLLIAMSMLLGALEQLRDSRRVLAVLVAFGTRRSILAGSLLWQSVVPVAVGLLIAGLVGSTLGSVLLRMVGRSADFDWGSMLGMAGIAAAAVLLVNLLTLPALRRSTRPDGIRSE
jgi:hypothetical protein